MPSPTDQPAASGSLSREAARRLDQRARDEFGLPELLLMENAAIGLARVVLAAAPVPTPNVAICCGSGNNGGDGLAAARHLHNAGAAVELWVLPGLLEPGPPGSLAHLHLDVARRMGIPVRPVPDSADARDIALGDASVIVDAVFGTGLNRPPSGAAARLIHAINRPMNRAGSGGPLVVSADLPSGLDADSGEPLDAGCCVRAGVTATFAAPKRGFSNPRSGPWIGEVEVVGIGVPRGLLNQELDHTSPPGSPSRS